MFLHHFIAYDGQSAVSGMIVAPFLDSFILPMYRLFTLYLFLDAGHHFPKIWDESYNLCGANFRGANLRGADLHGADLREANLARTDLTEANLNGANLSEADLTKANLRGTDLSGTNLEEAKFLIDTDLREVKGLTDTQKAACKARGAIIEDAPTTSAPQSIIAPALPSQSNDAQTPLTPSAQESRLSPNPDGSNTASSQPDPES